MVWERTQQAIQDMVDEAQKAKRYYSDAFDVYDRLRYHYGSYEVSEGKADTYSVEGDNAELRHYLDAWPVGHAVFLVAQMRCFVLLSSLSFASIDVSFSNNVSRITQPMYSNLSKPILYLLPKIKLE